MITFNNSVCIAGNVEAFFDIWLLGDRFLRYIYNEFESMMQQSQMNNDCEPFYMNKYHNVMGFFDEKEVIPEGMARIINSLLEVINTRQRLPRFLLIAIDKDVIQDLDFYEFDSFMALEEVVTWLTRQINIIIRRKKLELNAKKPGAVFRWFKFTLKPPNRITRGKLRLAIWDTSFWTSWLKFGHKGPYDIS